VKELWKSVSVKFDEFVTKISDILFWITLYMKLMISTNVYPGNLGTLCVAFLQGVSGSCKPCTSYDRSVWNGRSSSPKVLILALIESAYATSYWSSIVTLVLSCSVSEIFQVFCWEERPHPYSTRILGCSPWTTVCGEKIPHETNIIIFGIV